MGVQQEFIVNDDIRIAGAVTFSDMDLDYAVNGEDRAGLKENNVNWRLGVSYDITPYLTPFIGISDGSRLPTPTVIASGFFVGDPD